MEERDQGMLTVPIIVVRAQSWPDARVGIAEGISGVQVAVEEDIRILVMTKQSQIAFKMGASSLSRAT